MVQWKITYYMKGTYYWKNPPIFTSMILVGKVIKLVLFSQGLRRWGTFSWGKGPLATLCWDAWSHRSRKPKKHRSFRNSTTVTTRWTPRIVVFSLPTLYQAKSECHTDRIQPVESRFSATQAEIGRRSYSLVAVFQSVRFFGKNSIRCTKT